MASGKQRRGRGNRRGRGRNSGRDISGFLLLDKPAGITSNAALQQVKRLLNARKAGHTGSLDPLATGLLPISLGAGTRFSSFLLDSDKHYTAVCQLGVKTTTADSEGEVIATRPPEGVTEQRLEPILDNYRGDIMQIPPMHSALKHQGQPLYKLARQGIEIEREPRPVSIYRLELLRLDGDIMELAAHCSRGTYIRTLAEDIGEDLGCGAHITALRRTGVGPFCDPSRWLTLETLTELSGQGIEALDSVILPMEQALTQHPEVKLSADSAYYLRQGQPVLVPNAPTDGWVRLFDGEQSFLGMGEILDDGRVAPRRLLGAAN